VLFDKYNSKNSPKQVSPNCALHFMANYSTLELPTESSEPSAETRSTFSMFSPLFPDLEWSDFRMGDTPCPSTERQHAFGMSDPPSSERKHAFGMLDTPFPEKKDSFGMSNTPLPLPEGKSDFGMNIISSPSPGPEQSDFEMQVSLLPEPE
jgi:hypothetical protein